MGAAASLVPLWGGPGLGQRAVLQTGEDAGVLGTRPQRGRWLLGDGRLWVPPRRQWGRPWLTAGSEPPLGGRAAALPLGAAGPADDSHPSRRPGRELGLKDDKAPAESGQSGSFDVRGDDSSSLTAYHTMMTLSRAHPVCPVI